MQPAAGWKLSISELPGKQQKVAAASGVGTPCQSRTVEGPDIGRDETSGYICVKSCAKNCMTSMSMFARPNFPKFATMTKVSPAGKGEPGFRYP